ncbi:hypothetical protein QWI44_02830 [Acinetobacter pittii]|uniref:hypothetical protein n=1 Tax=Acinetobacter pittii TaxID=48296 RepID=UPI00274104F7|nr:hypothetical protein [Acinetobacter pittii]MDP7899631.1 hypothetical protein [Acinetobacter pittii]
MDNSREEEFEKFARWYALPLDKSEDGIYLALETQSAWVACQNWQAKVEEQAQEIANLKSLIQGHELRHQQNLSIKQMLTRRSEELQKQVDAALAVLTEYYTGSYDESPDLVVDIEQALKGEG